MQLTTTTKAQRIASEIESITSQTLAFVEAQLTRIHALANTPGEQSAILAAFGKNGVAALSAYGAFHAALTTAITRHNAPAVDAQVFQPQADGSILYVEPLAAEEFPQA
jgi:hypothetical protein